MSTMNYVSSSPCHNCEHLLGDIECLTCLFHDQILEEVFEEALVDDIYNDWYYGRASEYMEFDDYLIALREFVGPLKWCEKCNYSYHKDHGEECDSIPF